MQVIARLIVSNPLFVKTIIFMFKIKKSLQKTFNLNKDKRKYKQLNDLLKLIQTGDVTNIYNIFCMKRLVTSSQLISVYRFMHSLGCITFTLATIATFPFLGFEQDQLPYIFSTLIKFSALTFIVTEMLELVTVPIPQWRTPLCVFSFSGQIAYFCSTEAYRPFNNGPLYLWGALQVICVALLKILSIFTEKRQMEEVVRRGKNRFFQYGLVALANVPFLIGTLILWKTPRNTTVGCLVDSIGGCILSLSILSFFWQQKYRGYQKFNTKSAMAQQFS